MDRCILRHPPGCVRAREDEQPIGQTQYTTKEPKRTTDVHVFVGKVINTEQLTKIEQLTEAKEIKLKEPTVRGEELEPRKEKIKWPTSADKAIWKAFNEDLENILEATLAGNVDRKMRAMTSIIYSVGKDRFGLITSGKRERTQGQSNRRQRKIKELRGDIRRLKKRNRDAYEEERLML
ncbi:unnamed protein product [Mytilus coruscus]|uniref:Reverse transcriptase domain-containing protein n=1 Tax=Mytilus coruscus TaxID=42192 RepID=A0A6J8BU95_MYTCO|nr:unnamed protein product [Mytilus coruscus]